MGNLTFNCGFSMVIQKYFSANSKLHWFLAQKLKEAMPIRFMISSVNWYNSEKILVYPFEYFKGFNLIYIYL